MMLQVCPDWRARGWGGSTIPGLAVCMSPRDGDEVVGWSGRALLILCTGLER